MTALRIKLSEPVKTFVENHAAKVGCSPDEFVQSLLEDFEIAVEKRRLNEMLLAGYRQLREGRGRIMTDKDWDRLEKRIDKKAKRAKR